MKGQTGGPPVGITLRAVLIGLAATAAACLITCWADLVITFIQIAILQFPPVVVGLFVVLFALNAAARRLAKQWGLSPAEVLTIYSMTLVGAMVAARGLMEKWLSTLASINYYATPENGWMRIFGPHLRRWMVPFDPAGPDKQHVTVRFFEGLRKGESIPWGDWLLPIASWSVLVLLVFMGFFCLAALLRRQWVENERLTFPLTALPLEMARPDTGPAFLRNKLTWLGFALPAVLFGVNGLHLVEPTVPEIPTAINLNQYLPYIHPYTGIFYTTAYISLAAVGFFYLLPLDLVFSLWFFFLLTRVQDYLFTRYGASMDMMPLYPTHLMQGYQVMGAYFVLVGYLVKTGWPHVRAVLRRAVWGDRNVDDSQELLPYRTAVIGLGLSFGGSVLWCWLAGMSWWVAAVQMFVYLFVVVIVMARSVAEGGLLMTETSFRPLDLVTLFGTRSMLGPANLTGLSFTDAIFTRDLRGVLLTGLLDGLRLSDGVRQRRRSLLMPLVLAVLAAMVVAGLLHLLLPYHRGGLMLYTYVYQANNIWAFQDSAAGLTGQTHFDSRALLFFGVGAVVTLALAAARAAWFWFPLHPLGYAVSASWTMIVFWFPCLVAWVVKGLVQRYGGMKGYRLLRPFFLGLILGEFSSAVGWKVFSFATGHTAPSFPWP